MAGVLLPGQAGQQQAAVVQVALLRAQMSAHLAGPLLACEWARALEEAANEADPYGSQEGPVELRSAVKSQLVAGLALDVADRLLEMVGLVERKES